MAEYVMAKELHDLMLAYYRKQQWDKAAEQCRELMGEFDGQMDHYYELWLERIEEMRTHDLPKDWDGIYRATSK
jgi:hypothetical protein